MFSTIVVLVLLAIIGVLIYAATKPDTFKIERTTLINAAPDKIFPMINELRKWDDWSPWEKLDPNMKKSFTGSASGKGAVHEWEGNMTVGAGRMEITDSTPSSKVQIKLDFIKPCEGHNFAEFNLLPEGNTTKVTWLMYGPMTYPRKVMSLLCRMDNMVGKQFDQGLAALKDLSEK